MLYPVRQKVGKPAGTAVFVIVVDGVVVAAGELEGGEGRIRLGARRAVEDLAYLEVLEIAGFAELAATHDRSSVEAGPVAFRYRRFALGDVAARNLVGEDPAQRREALALDPRFGIPETRAHQRLRAVKIDLFDLDQNPRPRRPSLHRQRYEQGGDRKSTRLNSSH